MDEVVKQQISIVQSSVKSNVPWTQDEPFVQSTYTYDTRTSQWVAQEASSAQPSADSEITHLELFSWNIDFMLPFGDSRMNAALQHLENLVSRLPETAAPVIFLNECTPSDMKLLTRTPWVQQHFALTDLDSSMWANAHYGTTTLVSKKLQIREVFRVHFSATTMERDGLFTDILLDNKLLRLCNAHFESLALSPPLRPKQLELISSHLHKPEVDFGLVAGDFNAIEPFDRSLHTDNNFTDAYLTHGGQEDTEEGCTWGQQAATYLRKQFGCSRMDKIFFRGDGAKCVSFERFGEGIEVEDEQEKERLVGLGFEKAWVTDHLGVRGSFELTSVETEIGEAEKGKL